MLHKQNLEIIKYFIEMWKINPYDVNDNGIDCLTSACCFNLNIEIKKYFFDKKK